MNHNEKVQKLERLNFVSVETELPQDDYVNPIFTDAGIMAEDFAFDAVRGCLSITEKLRKKLIEMQYDFSDSNCLEEIFAVFEEKFRNVWVSDRPEDGVYALIFFNRHEHVSYSWTWDPAEEPEETLVDRLIAYGQAYLDVDWGEDE